MGENLKRHREVATNVVKVISLRRNRPSVDEYRKIVSMGGKCEVVGLSAL